MKLGGSEFSTMRRKIRPTGGSAANENGEPTSVMGRLFSPVLNYFNGEEGEEDGVEGEGKKLNFNDPDLSYSNDHNESVNNSVNNSVSSPASSKSTPQANNRSPKPSLDTSGTSYDSALNEEGDSMECDEEADEDYVEEFNPYLFIKQLPSYNQVSIPGKICLPPKSKTEKKVSLVLDLDETLVHCTVDPIDNADMVFPVEFGGVEYQVHVRKRPFLKEFLEAVYDKFEVIVFTASQKVYADELLNRIDPENKYIRHRLFRESCLPVEGNYLKDLNVLDRSLKHCVLVDNSPHAFGYQVDNGIPIESWFDDPNDTELVKLEKFLRTIQNSDDVTVNVRDQFKTYQLIAEA